MSHDRMLTAMTQLALSADGAFFGVGVAYVAFRCIRRYTYMSSARDRIRQAPEVLPSDLRGVLSGFDRGEDVNISSAEKLVIVRGIVEAKSAAEKGGWKDSKGSNGSLVAAPLSGEMGVILEQSRTFIHNEWRRFLWWTTDLWSLVSSSWKGKELLLIKAVPFALVEPRDSSESDFVVVNLQGSSHPLPLKAVYQDFQPTSATPYSLLCALSGVNYPVGILYEEKVLPVGTGVTAVGVCRLKGGTPEIKSCDDLPYFLSDLTQNEMVSDISSKMKVLIWGGFVLGSLAVCILGYSTARNWRRWKEWRHHQRLQTSSSTSNDPSATDEESAEPAADEEPGDVPDGELCVVCVMRRRRVAFTPCGHLVCCPRCAFAVEREASPLCPVCRQSVRGSVRIYVS